MDQPPPSDPNTPQPPDGGSPFEPPSQVGPFDRPPVVPTDPVPIVAPQRASSQVAGAGGFLTTMLAWIVIVVAVLGISVMTFVEGQQGSGLEDEPDRLGLLLHEVQSKYLMGATQIPGGDGPMLFRQAEVMLNIGTIPQRQRFVVLAAELGGFEEAADVLANLDEQLADPPVGDPPTLNENEERMQDLLHRMYAATDEGEPADRIASLDQSDRDFLTAEMGWFGDLALAPISSDRRGAVMRSASAVTWVILGAAILGGGVALLGFIGLVIMAVLLAIGKLRGGLAPGAGRHGLYAETFALWLLLFFGFQIPAAFAPPDFLLAAVAVGFFASLIALIWPVFRGIPWASVRSDVGWTWGRNPIVEFFVGLGGYAMTLPLLGVGLLLTLLLMSLQSSFSSPAETFAPAGGPAHPIVAEIAGGTIWMKVQIYFLASIAAPIVEETMFRGVLYRHLRDASRPIGAILSVMAGALVSSFIFAAIHPQGWVAIPALMSLAVGFVLAREWRGSLVAPMVMHGVSNGLVMTLVMLMFSA